MFNKINKILIVMVLGMILIVPNSYAADPGVNYTFDILPGINPKILPIDGKLPVQLNINIDLAKYGTFCNNTNTTSFKWSVWGDFGGWGSDINYGAEKTVSFERNQAIISKIINDTITVTDNGRGRTGNYVYKLYAWIECADGTDASKSSNVLVTAGSGNTISTCIVPSGSGYTFACSPANTTNCSDVPNCGNTCTQTRVSLCGQAAPPPSSITPGSGTGCGTPGQPACPPGRDQEYSFNIENPLKGGASDFTSLVKIIAQWIFNLAIPIAVAMIVYSGILFLTAQGEPGKVTKAKDVLKYAVIGLAIILIGSGFVTLIQSILELGAPSSNSGQPTLPINGSSGTTTTLGAVGNKCSRDRDCNQSFGLKCSNGICQRANGNFVGEACVGGVSCAQSLACDLTSEGRQVIDGQTLGSCFQP